MCYIYDEYGISVNILLHLYDSRVQAMAMNLTISAQSSMKTKMKTHVDFP